jgi:hypothetical protein
MSEGPRESWLVHLARQRSLQFALLGWALLSAGGIVLGGNKLPLDCPAFARGTTILHVAMSWFVLALVLLDMGVVYLLTRRRAVPDMAARSPERDVALREVSWLWIYGAAVMVGGRILGLHLFGEGISMHLNGSLLGATRVQSPTEVWTWAGFNFVLLALLPYVVFRMRGYSREALNLRSSNLKNDLLVIAVVLAFGCAFDLSGPNFWRMTHHQQLAGGLLSFVVNLLGTCLPVMVFIYAILLPRYEKLFSPATAFLLGAASYPAMHVFEYWTRYDSVKDGMLSVIFVFLTFLPPGLMKSFLTIRTGNAWVHVWAFHAISPHVTADTPLVVRDFRIR